jgi:hypothetical protein
LVGFLVGLSQFLGALQQYLPNPWLAVDGEVAMKLIAKYLDIAIKFERLAAQETASMKKSFQEQAAAFHKLANKRAKKLGIPEPPASINQLALYLADLNRQQSRRR